MQRSQQYWHKFAEPSHLYFLPGDLDIDFKLINRWERHTGRSYKYAGISDNEDDADDCNVEDSHAAALGSADVQREASFSAGSLAGGSSSSYNAGLHGNGCQQPAVPVLAMHRMGGGLHCPMELAPLALAAAGSSSTPFPGRVCASTAAVAENGEASILSEELDQLGFGYDLDEDVERLVAAEEAGMSLAAAGIPQHYASTLDQDAGSSSSSELIAAGRHVEDLEEEEEEEELQRWGSGGSDGLPGGSQAGCMPRGGTTSSSGHQAPAAPAEGR